MTFFMLMKSLQAEKDESDTCFGQSETSTRWCPSSLAKLVYNSNNYGLW